MKSIAKSQATIRELKERLQFRFKGSATIDTVRDAIDSNGWSMLFCSDGGVETAGAAVIAIRIKAINAVSKDVFGNDLIAFGPHELEIAYELTAGGVQTPAQRDLIKAMLEVSKLGMKVVVKEIANTVAVTAANMDAASAVDALDYEVVWANKGL